MRIVFFDIDGVLNGESDPVDSPAITPDKIELLNQLVDNGVVFVLSSSWRGTHSFYEMKQGLRELGFNGRLVDFTTHMWEDLEGRVLHRGDQILLWIKTHRDDIEGYVILDDCPIKCADVENNWIKVNDPNGITKKDIDQAREILWRNDV